jgi:hypothetical protein
MVQKVSIPLRRLKRSIFLGAKVCPRAMRRGARASGFSETLNHVFNTILFRV